MGPIIITAYSFFILISLSSMIVPCRHRVINANCVILLFQCIFLSQRVRFFSSFYSPLLIFFYNVYLHEYFHHVHSYTREHKITIKHFTFYDRQSELLNRIISFIKMINITNIAKNMKFASTSR